MKHLLFIISITCLVISILLLSHAEDDMYQTFFKSTAIISCLGIFRTLSLLGTDSSALKKLHEPVNKKKELKSTNEIF